jgi:hypothetical protein
MDPMNDDVDVMVPVTELDMTMTTSENLFMVVIRFMNLAEGMDNVTSAEKKHFVETALEVHLGTTGFARYGPLLDVLIDGVVGLTRKDIKLAINQTKKCLFSCFKP